MTRRLILVPLAALLCAAGDTDAVMEAPLEPWPSRDYWPWVEFVSIGPVAWLAEDKATGNVAGRQLRVAKMQSEETVTVLIEESTLGEEGCCNKLQNVRELDLYGVAKELGTHVSFVFLEWKTPDSFAFCLGRHELVASKLTAQKALVQRSVASNKALQPTPSRCALGRG